MGEGGQAAGAPVSGHAADFSERAMTASGQKERLVPQTAEQFASGPRILAVTGHFGSGKTEFAVSLALALARRGTGERLALCDLDIENPYFRSRERQTLLEEAGVRVYSDPFQGRNGSELQTISAAIRAPLEDPGCRVICDCGGDRSGAMILNQFKKYFRPGEYRLLCVVNAFRPGTDTPEKAAEHVRQIAAATGLRPAGLISNGHLLRETAPEDVRAGWELTRAAGALTGLPVLCACCMEALVPAVEDLGIPAFPIGMYMRESYLDRKV